jgi:hypothetical protein
MGKGEQRSAEAPNCNISPSGRERPLSHPDSRTWAQVPGREVSVKLGALHPALSWAGPHPGTGIGSPGYLTRDGKGSCPRRLPRAIRDTPAYQAILGVVSSDSWWWQLGPPPCGCHLTLGALPWKSQDKTTWLWAGAAGQEQAVCSGPEDWDVGQGRWLCGNPGQASQLLGMAV